MPQPPVSAAAQEFGQRLRKQRQAKKLTQLNLAYQSGSTVAAISNYENGRALPSLSTLLDIAYVLEIDPGTLIKRLQPDTPPTELLAQPHRRRAT
ncbi:helix-turn-helix transcriptional regulator [Kribbella sp.]|uniref:helix-turn-helix domain-containing protein n=1 Tax=Kribbella sp. TaxID=1871183 RepID=UPI002D407B19|nr:helix-turn-helix transcriptional regulator [Kribbella sp.]HZX08263.1 helix-turn-helix transcriptional regulator [Kribbella sp.]